MTFGEKLAQARTQAGMTQAELAKKLKVSRQAVTKWEVGGGVPDIDNLLKLSLLFEISVEDFFDYKIERLQYVLTEKEEEIDPQNGKWKNVEHFVMERFSDTERIFWLARERKLNAWEWLLDFFIGAGTLEMADILKTGLVYAFLVEKEGGQRLVLIHKNKMVIKTLQTPFEGKKYVLDKYKYVKVKRIR